MRVALDGGPYGVAASPDGALWVTLADAGKIARVTMDGSVQQFKAGKKPMQITPHGWFTFAGGVGRVTPDGIVTTTKVSGSPYGIVEGPGQRRLVHGREHDRPLQRQVPVVRGALDAGDDRQRPRRRAVVHAQRDELRRPDHDRRHR